VIYPKAEQRIVRDDGIILTYPHINCVIPVGDRHPTTLAGFIPVVLPAGSSFTSGISRQIRRRFKTTISAESSPSTGSQTAGKRIRIERCGRSAIARTCSIIRDHSCWAANSLVVANDQLEKRGGFVQRPMAGLGAQIPVGILQDWLRTLYGRRPQSAAGS